MIRKTLTILSLIGLLVSLGLWGVGSFYSLSYLSASSFIGVHDDSVVIDAYPRGNIPVSLQGWLWQKGRTPVLRLDMPQHFNEMPWHDKWHLKLPLWIPTVVFAIGSISFILIPFHRRRKRKKLGLCIKCGYDLRASKDRCPECGEEFGSTGVVP